MGRWARWNDSAQSGCGISIILWQACSAHHQVQYIDQRWQPVQLKSGDLQMFKSTQLTTDRGREHPEPTHRGDGTGGNLERICRLWERVGNGLERVGCCGKRKGMLSAAGNIRGCAESTGGCFPIAGSDVFPTITLWEVFPTLFVADYLSSDQWGE